MKWTIYIKNQPSKASPDTTLLDLMNLNPLENRPLRTHSAESTARISATQAPFIRSMAADTAKLSAIPTSFQAASDQLPEIRPDAVALARDFLNSLKDNSEKKAEVVDILASSLKFSIHEFEGLSKSISI